MDVLTLHALSDKDRFRTLRSVVPEGMMGPETCFVIDWIEQYWKVYPAHQKVDPQALRELIKLRGGYQPEQLAVVLNLVNQLDKPVDPDSLQGVVSQLNELDFSGRVDALLAQYNQGEDIDLAYELRRLSDEALRREGVSTPTDYVTDDVFDILAEEQGDHGIKLPGLVLPAYMKGLHAGASVLVAAPPDAGKTSFMAWIAVHIAPQLKRYFDPGRPILWLNNEGKGRRIKPRLYSAALGMTVGEILALDPEEVRRMYAEKIGGDSELIRIKDFHGGSLAQAEQVIDAMKPAVVFWDMMAHVKGGQRKDQNRTDEMEYKVAEVREMAVRHDFISFMTWQISNDGHDQLFPPQSCLKDSKTAVQGAVDVQIHLGRLNGADQQVMRGLSLPKNKFQMDGKPSNVEAMINFDAARCRFFESVDHAS
ncbi:MULTISPECIES: AAA family ATPase [Bacteria]|uniref:Putative DNA helicase n=1 Tax=Pseudomonas phage vB_PaeP_PAO1_Ab05 TaxID=1548902 RepID=A0A0A1IVI3_9CAUD|nr:AAA family ATPase [Pseudomonas aeruginosa]YP_009125717.1 AAA family ATPase [Pseudomonas phage vB_PaeP_PAO1_Ab05]MBW6072181.1 AAA family ATPase [Pseudomonas aeruginosa]CEF89280.1 putative DNA helicase [Pseudomonas phage vB_PaeP_PAO1_Ab05]